MGSNTVQWMHVSPHFSVLLLPDWKGVRQPVLFNKQPSPAWATNWNDPSTEYYRITHLSPPGYESFPFPSTLQLLDHQLFIIHRVRFQERLSSNILHAESQKTLT
jgi:hypothetical protein